VLVTDVGDGRVTLAIAGEASCDVNVVAELLRRFGSSSWRTVRCPDSKIDAAPCLLQPLPEGTFLSCILYDMLGNVLRLFAHALTWAYLCCVSNGHAVSI
jgi:hypothetical protein